MTTEKAQLLLGRWIEATYTRAAGLFFWNLLLLLLQVLAGWWLCVMLVGFAALVLVCHFHPVAILIGIFLVLTPDLWVAVFHPVISTFVYGAFLIRPAWRFFRGLDGGGFGGAFPQSGRPTFVSGVRQTNYRRGALLGILWEYAVGLYSAPFRRARIVAGYWRLWRNPAPVVPDGAAAEVAWLFPQDGKGFWVPVRERPELCPLLEELLAMRVIRLRENANTGVEARIDNDFEKFACRTGFWSCTDA